MARVRLTIEFEPELRRRVEDVAFSHETSVHEWIERVVRRELEREETEAGAVSQLSRPSFARDWESEEDSIYDELDH